MNLPTDLSGIINQLEQQRALIDRALAALREISGVQPEPSAQLAPLVRRGRPRNDAGAALESAPETASKKATKKKRVLSPEGRQRIIEATQRRWAKKKAEDAAAAQKKPVKKGRRPA